MTGGDLKAVLVVIGLTIGLPGLLVAILRLVLEEKPEPWDSWWGRPVKLALGALGSFAVALFISWNDKTAVGFMFGQSLAVAAVVTLHVIVVIVSAKLFQLFLKPRFPHIYASFYGVLFALALLFHTSAEGWAFNQLRAAKGSAVRVLPYPATATIAPVRHVRLLA